MWGLLLWWRVGLLWPETNCQKNNSFLSVLIFRSFSHPFLKTPLPSLGKPYFPGFFPSPQLFLRLLPWALPPCFVLTYGCSGLRPQASSLTLPVPPTSTSHFQLKLPNWYLQSRPSESNRAYSTAWCKQHLGCLHPSCTKLKSLSSILPSKELLFSSFC